MEGNWYHMKYLVSMIDCIQSTENVGLEKWEVECTSNRNNNNDSLEKPFLDDSPVPSEMLSDKHTHAKATHWLIQDMHGYLMLPEQILTTPKPKVLSFIVYKLVIGKWRESKGKLGLNQ